MDKTRESQLNLKKQRTRENTIILNNVNRKEEKKLPKQDNRRE